MELHRSSSVEGADRGAQGSLSARFDGRAQALRSSAYEIAAQFKDAVLVIGSVLVPGAAAPKVVTDAMVRGVKHGAVLVDISIDQGGCLKHAVATSHVELVYGVHDTVYFCVANMIGAVPITSVEALTNVSFALPPEYRRKGLVLEKLLSSGFML